MCAYLPIHLPLLTLAQQSIIRHFKQRWWCVSRVHMAPSKGTKICNWPRKTVFVSITAASPPAVDFYDPVTLGLYVLPREMGSHRWKLTGMQLNHSKLTNKLILGQNGEVNISSSHWEWLGDPHLQMMAKRLLKMFMLGSSCWEQQWYCYCGMGQWGDARVFPTCAVTQTIPSLFSNTQGSQFSFPSLLDWFCNHKSNCQAFGGKKQLHQRAVNQHKVRLSSWGNATLLRFAWTLHPIQNSAQKYDALTITSAGPCFSVQVMCLISC